MPKVGDVTSRHWLAPVEALHHEPTLGINIDRFTHERRSTAEVDPNVAPNRGTLREVRITDATAVSVTTICPEVLPEAHPVVQALRKEVGASRRNTLNRT